MEMKTLTIVEGAKIIKVGKDDEDFGKKVFEYLKTKGVTHNIRGKKLTVDKVTQQLKRMLYDIKTKRAGWWSNWEFINTDTHFGMKQKEQVKVK